MRPGGLWKISLAIFFGQIIWKNSLANSLKILWKLSCDVFCGKNGKIFGSSWSKLFGSIIDTILWTFSLEKSLENIFGKFPLEKILREFLWKKIGNLIWKKRKMWKIFSLRHRGVDKTCFTIIFLAMGPLCPYIGSTNAPGKVDPIMS